MMSTADRRDRQVKGVTGLGRRIRGDVDGRPDRRDGEEWGVPAEGLRPDISAVDFFDDLAFDAAIKGGVVHNLIGSYAVMKAMRTCPSTRQTR